MERAVLKSVDDFANFEEEFIEQGRRGVIELPVPMLNINEWSAFPSYYALALGMTGEQFERLAYYADIVVKESSLEGFTAGEILSTDRFKEYESLPAEDKEKISLIEGAEAIDLLIGRLDLDAKIKEAREQEISLMQNKEKLFEIYDELGGDEMSWKMHEKMRDAEADEEGNDEVDLSEEERAFLDAEKSIDDVSTDLKAIRCLLTGLRRIKACGTKNLIINEIEVFPIDTRGIVREMASELPYAIYDIESAYYKVTCRAERTKKLMDMGAPHVILRNEKRMLQEKIDALINNGARGTVLSGRRPEEAAASLTDLMYRRSKLV